MIKIIKLCLACVVAVIAGYISADLLNTLTDIPRHKVVPHVVGFLTPTGNIYGTGFHLEWKGKTYLITNKHMCDSGKRILKSNILKTTFGSHKILHTYKKHDLCLLSTKSNTGLRLAYFSPEVLDKVTLIGHPRGLNLNIEEGRIINKSKVVCVMTQGCPVSFLISALSYPGNSGSPVVNIFGNVVGVLFAGSPTYPHHPLVVPYKSIKRFLNSVTNSKRSK